DHTEWVPWVSQWWYFSDRNSPAGFGRGIPSWEWRPTVERVNSILRAWGLPELPPRPKPVASSPGLRRLRVREIVEARRRAAEGAEPPKLGEASEADWEEIEERKVSPLSARAIATKQDPPNRPLTGKLRNFIFTDGVPRVGERSDVHWWM